MVTSVLTRLLSVLGLGGSGSQEGLEEKIDRVIVRLELLEDNIAETRYGLEKRSRELFRKVVELMRQGDKRRAAIYAGEVSQVRAVLKLIYTIEHMIIAVKERLKTVKDMRQLTGILMAFGVALKDVGSEISAIYPNMSMMIDQISSSVRQLITETAVEAMSVPDPAVISRGAMEILEEAKKKAEEKVREQFPDPPIEPVIPARATGLAAQAAVLAAAKRAGGEDLERLVLDYIRSHNGLLDIRDFTARYGVGKDEVLRALHRLAEKGLVALA